MHMSTSLAWILWLLSTMGYLLLGARCLHLSIALMPAVLCAAVSLVLTLAGYAGVLLPIARLLLVGGLMAWGLLLAWRSRPSQSEVALLVVFLFLCGYAAWLACRSSLVAYDNYTHWATVVKCMLQTDALPTPADKAVTYPSYPLGSSMVLYYVCRCIAPTDTWMQFGQLVLRFSFLLSLCALLHRKDLVMLPCIIAYGIFGLAKRITPTDLLVDVILPMAAVSAMAVLASCRAQPRRALVPFSLLMCLVCSIKQSGIFLMLLCLPLACWQLRHELKRAPVSTLAWLVGIPLLSFGLWRLHVSHTFGQAASHYHALSLTNYLHTFSSKTPAEVHDLLVRFWHFLWQPGEDTVPVLLLLAGTTLLLMLLRIAQGDRKAIWGRLVFLLGLLGILLLYNAGVAGMYLFSMNASEGLNSVERYVGTGLLLVVGLCCIDLMVQLPAALQGLRLACRGLACLTLVALFLLPVSLRWVYVPQLWLSQENDAYWKNKYSWDRHYYTVRTQLDAFLQEADPPIQPVTRVLAYTWDTSLWRYVFWDVPLVLETNAERLPERAGGSDVFLTCERADSISAFLQTLGEPIENDSGVLYYRLTTSNNERKETP